MTSVTINDDSNIAIVRIGKTEREHPINWVDDMPEFAEPVWAGVLLGNNGQKVWCCQLAIEKSIINPLHLDPPPVSYTLSASSALNTINHSTGWVREIAGFWDEIPENKKSKRSGDPQFVAHLIATEKKTTDKTKKELKCDLAEKAGKAETQKETKESTFATDAIKQESWWTETLKKDAVNLEQKIYEQEMKQKKTLAAEKEGLAAIAQFRKAIDAIEEAHSSFSLKSCFLREMAGEMIGAIAPYELQSLLQYMERTAERAIEEQANEEASEPQKAEIKVEILETKAEDRDVQSVEDSEAPKVVQVWLNKVEGRSDLCVEKFFPSLEAAEEQLALWQAINPPPKGGGYHKIDFLITWDDGFQYEGRLSNGGSLADFLTGNSSITPGEFMAKYFPGHQHKNANCMQSISVLPEK